VPSLAQKLVGYFFFWFDLKKCSDLISENRGQIYIVCKHRCKLLTNRCIRRIYKIENKEKIRFVAVVYELTVTQILCGN